MGKGASPTIFAEESPKAFAEDARLAAATCRSRGLPSDIAQAGYDTARRLLLRAEMDEHGFGKVAGGLAAIVKVDIETGRYEKGEPAGTINVNAQQNNQQQTPEQIAAAYVAAMKQQMEAAYQPPPAIPNSEANDNGNGKPPAT
jgi:hypothetical protein